MGNSLIKKERATSISKYLSLVLRHDPAAAGVTLDAEGWVSVEELLAGAARHGHSFTRAELDEVVQKSDKQRFAFSLDAQRIRANQGHSVSVDLGWKQSILTLMHSRPARERRRGSCRCTA
jgi:putative RNA 2'-phosphotransferase